MNSLIEYYVKYVSSIILINYDIYYHGNFIDNIYHEVI